MNNVIPFRNKEYIAKAFRAQSIYGDFQISGTICGSVDMALPIANFTLPLTIEEIDSLIIALTGARDDVVANANPKTDPRIIV